MIPPSEKLEDKPQRVCSVNLKSNSVSIKGGDNRWYLLYNPIYHNSFLQLYTTDIKVGENKQTCGAGFGQKAVPTIEFGYNNYFGGSCANNTHTSSNACKQILKNYK